eukprot:TRINITY_DN711_c0_g1_i1.p1 TRINITY_DN711_c0_g1~~TRINITY_DN711_c0_g1_i1.p1  ORF type:complete len:112 (-),score=25.52 TRINITY_DN711_c0_g1_i1:336-671(-)
MSVDRKLAEEVFTLFDTTGEGTIPASSLVTALGGYGLNPTQLEVESYLNECGAAIDFETFVHYVGENMKAARTGEAIFNEAFRVFDKEQNGSLAVSELRHVSFQYLWKEGR